MYRIEEYEQELRATSKGREIISIIKKHADEVSRLINENRQVTVTWQRNKGAYFLSQFIGSAFHDKKMIKETEGVTLSSLIRRMAVVLQDRCSVELSAAINEYLIMILEFSESPDSLHQVFKKFRQYE